MALTIKHDRKVRADKRYQEYKANRARQDEQEIQRYLKAASGIPAIKWKSPYDIFNLSLEKELELLDAYYWFLVEQEKEHIEKYGKGGERSARWIRMETGGVLKAIAKLRVRLARGDEPAKVKR